MKKRENLLVILFLFCFCLVGCHGEKPTTTPPPSTEPTAQTTEATEPPTEPVTEPTEPEWPFGEVEELSYLSYEEYFSQEREYDPGTDVCFGRSWFWDTLPPGETASLGEIGGILGIVKSGVRKIAYAVTDLADYENCVWILADGYWIYGVRNNEELFRIDYHGGNYETLFCDGVHTLEKVDRRTFFLADHCVLYFAIFTEDSATACRLYLPTMTLDTLYTCDHTEFHMWGPASNWAVCWEEENFEFRRLLESEIQDPDSPFYQYSEAAAETLSNYYQVPMSYLHYFNSVTGEHYILEDYGRYCNPRTQENIDKNGYAWWKDFQ